MTNRDYDNENNLRYTTETKNGLFKELVIAHNNGDLEWICIY